MPETPEQVLSGVAETLLVTLYLRAMESQPDSILHQQVRA